MFSAVDIRKTYRPRGGVPVEALRGVTLRFGERGMVFILGKSGNGKSTLLHILGGLDDADAGYLEIDGKTTQAFSRKDFDDYRNEYVGFVFQEYNLLPTFTVRENLSIALELQGKSASEEQIAAALAKVGLAGIEKRKPTELSGGQWQRVAIARAMIKEPEMVLADEPTGALDEETGQSVLKLLKQLSEEKLVIVVSHDRDFAERFGDRIIELADGAVVRDTGGRA